MTDETQFEEYNVSPDEEAVWAGGQWPGGIFTDSIIILTL